MLRKLLLLTIVACTIISCQKDFVIEDDIPVPPVISDSTLLEKYIEIDTTTAIPDTNLIALYKYDAQKRMTNLNWRFERITPGVYATDMDISFFYNGVDTLPNKMITVYKTNYGSTPYTAWDTSYLFFNASGVRIKDSTRSADTDGNYYIYKNNFTYANNNIYLHYIEDVITGGSGPGVTEERDTFYITRSNGNIVRQIDTSRSGFGEYYSRDFNFSYDDKINPFYLSQKMMSIWPILEFEMTILEISQKNNPVQIWNVGKESSGAGDDVFGRKFNYTYLPNNLPSSVIMKDFDATTGAEIYLTKGIFYYTR